MIRIGILSEILAILLCIYCIYGKKLLLNIQIVGLVLGILVILEGINYFGLSGIFSFSIYIILCFYCKYTFKVSTIKVVVNFLVTMLVITIIQSVCMICIEVLLPVSDVFRTVICNIILLLICKFVLPRLGLDSLSKCICKRNAFLIPLLCFICLVIFAMVLQKKIFYGVQIQYFVLTIPAIIIILYMIVKWHETQAVAEEREREVLLAEETQEQFKDLLINVRLRQHEFKNHLEAIFSAHYTCKTYEKLVKTQEVYCARMLNENKYNSLLLLEDYVIAGYLYGKFEEAELDGIEISYVINTKIDKCSISAYYVVEMLGILLDNAVETVKNRANKKISFEVSQIEHMYRFSIRNPYDYVTYDDIAEWFMFEKSEKGNGRGLGLYHLKGLCEKWNCNIVCKNIKIENENWVMFILEINKADSI